MQLHNDLTEIKCLVTFYEWAAGFGEVSGAVVSAGSGCGCGATFLVEIKKSLRFFFCFFRCPVFPALSHCHLIEKIARRMNGMNCLYAQNARG